MLGTAGRNSAPPFFVKAKMENDLKVGKTRRSARSLISLGAVMKVKYADAADAAGEDVLRWFELCETSGECVELANDMKGLIDSVAAT